MQRKGSQTQELTTICNGRHRRAGDGLSVPKPTTNHKILRRRIYTMKTLSKKILTVCLALMMAVVMAVPAFADWTLTPDRDDGNWSNNYLNINRPNDNTEMNGCSLILYHTTSLVIWRPLPSAWHTTATCISKSEHGMVSGGCRQLLFCDGECRKRWKLFQISVFAEQAGWFP